MTYFASLPSSSSSSGLQIERAFHSFTQLSTPPGRKRKTWTFDLVTLSRFHCTYRRHWNQHWQFFLHACDQNTECLHKTSGQQWNGGHVSVQANPAGIGIFFPYVNTFFYCNKFAGLLPMWEKPRVFSKLMTLSSVTEKTATGFEEKSLRTWSQYISISAKTQRVHSVWVSFQLRQ